VRTTVRVDVGARPHGIWTKPLRTGMYPINPKIYNQSCAHLDPTLNWASGKTNRSARPGQGPFLDRGEALDTFAFQDRPPVPDSRPDTQGPHSRGLLLTMQNLVTVLQPAAGAILHALQKIKAIDFISEARAEFNRAERSCANYLQPYHIEVRCVFTSKLRVPRRDDEGCRAREMPTTRAM